MGLIPNLKSTLLFLVLISTLSAGSPSPVRSSSGRKNTIVARFGGECAPPPLSATEQLRSLIHRERLRRDCFGDGPWCKGAHAIDLNGDGRKELLVPLVCGGTGNCTWGVYSDRPARFRGEFTAWFIWVEMGGSSWARLRTYTREGGDTGYIDMVMFTRDRYRVVSEYKEQTFGQERSPFLTKMGLPPCG